MFDYVYQRPLPIKSSFLISPIRLIFMCWNIFSYCLHGTESLPLNKSSLQTIFQQQYNTQLMPSSTKKLFRIIYYRENDINLDENRLKTDVKNLTDTYGIDLKINIINQSKSYTINNLCSIISQERRDTILIADLYTKEIDLISRSLQIPTIALINRYEIVQGKMHNPYLFKLMSDSVADAKFLADIIETRSVYTRIALIYDISLDMVEYRLTYLRIAKQHIIYRAQFPRISLSAEVHRAARTIIYDLTRIHIDLILCLMSTERELQFVRLINELGSPAISQYLFNQTSWWFASRLYETKKSNFFPNIYTAKENRIKTLSNFSSTSMKILLNSALRTYVRLSNISSMSSLWIGPATCDNHLNIYQIKKTQMFIKLFTNYAEWSCDMRPINGFYPILFEPKTLLWRVPTTFFVHTAHTCQGLLARTFSAGILSADQFFHSCRANNPLSRKIPPSNQNENLSTSIIPSSSNTIVELENFHNIIAVIERGFGGGCRFINLDMPSLPQTTIVVGVVEPPYIFVSDAEISSDFPCNYGLPCHQIEPPAPNTTMDALFFRSKTLSPPHCCYGISIKILLRMEDSNLVSALKRIKLFVFSDKPNKWLALTETLKNRRAHLSISPIPYESFLARSLDLSPPFYHSTYVILTTPTPTGPLLGTFLQPFSWTTWLMIFLVLNATALFETFFEWHSPYGLTPKGRRRHKVFSLASALTLSWSIVFSHTFKTKSPKCWSNRFLGNVWGGFGIVFIAIYTAKLAAFMVELPETQSAKTLKGIIDECTENSECQVGVVPNTSDEEYLRNAFSRTLYPRRFNVSSYTEGIELLSQHAITHLLMDHSMARYYITRQVFKSLRVSGDNFGSFGLSLAFSKFESNLKNSITNILLSYMDKGIIQRFHDDWYIYENCEIKRLNENRDLSVDRFTGVFILLIVGMLIGAIILGLEWMTFKYGVPYWRKRQWPGWMFLSQRLYAILNVSDEVYNEAYRSSKTHSFRSVGERLHNYSTRSDSLDLHVVDVPKLLCTTYQLNEQMTKLREQQQQQQQISVLPPNGEIKRDNNSEQDTIRHRITELEQELNQLRLQLSLINQT